MLFLDEWLFFCHAAAVFKLYIFYSLLELADVGELLSCEWGIRLLVLFLTTLIKFQHFLQITNDIWIILSFFLWIEIVLLKTKTILTWFVKFSGQQVLTLPLWQAYLSDQSAVMHYFWIPIIRQLQCSLNLLFHTIWVLPNLSC